MRTHFCMHECSQTFRLPKCWLCQWFKKRAHPGGGSDKREALFSFRSQPSQNSNPTRAPLEKNPSCANSGIGGSTAGASGRPRIERPVDLATLHLRWRPWNLPQCTFHILTNGKLCFRSDPNLHYWGKTRRRKNTVGNKEMLHGTFRNALPTF